VWKTGQEGTALKGSDKVDGVIKLYKYSVMAQDRAGRQTSESREPAGGLFGVLNDLTFPKYDKCMVELLSRERESGDCGVINSGLVGRSIVERGPSSIWRVVVGEELQNSNFAMVEIELRRSLS
jgi:hypothetical protein